MTPEERDLEAYYERLSMSFRSTSRVISIEFQSEDPELAAQVVNAVAERYLVLQQAAKLDRRVRPVSGCPARSTICAGKVAEAEAKVEEFRAKTNLFIGTNNTTLSNQQLGEFNTQIGTARAQKADLKRGRGSSAKCSVPAGRSRRPTSSIRNSSAGWPSSG